MCGWRMLRQFRKNVLGNLGGKLAQGAADYMRRELNAMDEATFRHFVDYTIAISQRPELLGAGTHVVDVLING